MGTTWNASRRIVPGIRNLSGTAPRAMYAASIATVVRARTATAGHLPRSARIVPAHNAIALTSARNVSFTTSPGVPEKAATSREGQDHAVVRVATRGATSVRTAVVLT